MLFEGFFYASKQTKSEKVRVTYPGSEKVFLLTFRVLKGLKSFAAEN